MVLSRGGAQYFTFLQRTTTPCTGLAWPMTVSVSNRDELHGTPLGCGGARIRYALAVARVFNHGHRSTAIRAYKSRLNGFSRQRFILWRHGNNMRQLPYPRQIGAAPVIGDQPPVSDTVKSTRQQMQQEAPHELIRAEHHGLVARRALSSIIFPVEGHATFIQGIQP